MTIYAIYRMYYGEDFIEESILSIYNCVDKIFVFASPAAFGNVYKGRVDDSLKVVQEILDPDRKIHILHNKKCYLDPMNQFTCLYNTYIYKVYDPPDAVMCIEPDMVWEEEELENYLVTAYILPEDRSLIASQIEFWHNNRWEIPPRHRKTLITHRLDKDHRMPKTDRSGHRIKGSMVTSSRKVYNYGFCITPKNMRMKCDLAIAYSKLIGDSIPNPHWYENKWYKWHNIYNNKDLEISAGYEHLIPFARLTSIRTPEVLKYHEWNKSTFIPAPE